MTNQQKTTSDSPPPLQVDPQGNVYTAEGVKICRVDTQRQMLLFLDEDKRRIARRGSDQLPVTIAALVQLANGAGAAERRPGGE